MSPRTKTASSITVNEAFDRAYREHYRWTKGHVMAAVNMRLVSDALGADLALAKVDTRRVVSLVNRFKEVGNKPATINRKLAVLRAVMRLAVREMWCDSVTAVPHFPRQKEPVGRVRFLTADEESALLAHTRDVNARVVGLWVFLLDTGARLGEALGLTADTVVDSVRSKSWTIRDTKSGKPRTVPLTERAVNALDKWHWEGLHKYQVEWVWHSARLQMGLKGDPEFVIHALRHTFASRLVQRGVDLYRVQALLGHSSPAVTARYAHLRRDDLVAAVSVLESEVDA